jgi:hypothetical protein
VDSSLEFREISTVAKDVHFSTWHLALRAYPESVQSATLVG